MYINIHIYIYIYKYKCHIKPLLEILDTELAAGLAFLGGSNAVKICACEVAGGAGPESARDLI